MNYEDLFKKQPATLLDKIVSELLKNDSVDVLFEDHTDEQWSAVKLHLYDEDIEMAIRLLSENRWMLQLGYYDKDDDFVELVEDLKPADAEKIPVALQKVMLKVLASEEGLRVPASFFSK